MMSELVTHPAFMRAVVLGAFGGIGLVLTTMFSRRGPLIFPVYAAILGSLALLLTRYADLAFPIRLSTAMAGFLVAAGMHYVAVGISANRERRKLGFTENIPFLGHLWRLSVLFTIGFVASAGVAFVAS
jgi:hypothetical protein